MQAKDLGDLARVRALVDSGAARVVRVSKRLSLSEVALTVGVSKSTVFRWEAGERTPRGEKALRYGRLLEQLMARQS